MRNNRFELFSVSVCQLVRSVTALKNQKMAKYGLKGTGASCLCYILESPNGLTAQELSKQGEIDKAQVSRCMSELIEKELAFLSGEEGKKYKRKYHLTARGEVVAKDIQNTSLLLQTAMSAGISDQDMEVFYRTLYRLCDNFDRMLAIEKANDEA